MTAAARVDRDSPAIAFTASRPDGPTVVMFHGVTRCRDDWQEVVHGLARSAGSQGWRVIAVDHRGHGDSARADRRIARSMALPQRSSG